MYKLSKYNYFIPNKERIIYFNGLSGNVFSVSQKEHEFIQEKFVDPISFQIQYDSVFRKFQEWGFIINEGTNELDYIRLRNRRAVFSNKFYRLVINPTQDCIFRCWYCYEDHPKGHMSTDTVEQVKKHILWMVENEKISGLFLDWFGGEPLMYFNKVIYPIAQYAGDLMKKNDLPFQHHITTNAYLITPKMIGQFKEIGLNTFQITIDGDEQRHNTIRNINGKPCFARIMENIVSLCESLPDVSIGLRVNYDDETLESSDMDHVLSLIPETYRKHIRVNFQRVWQTVNSSLGENEKRIALSKKCEQMGFMPCLLSNVFSIGNPTACYVDKYYHTEINYDGKIYKCTARNYTDQYVKGQLCDDGRIEWYPEKMAEMYGKATFENEMCLNCKQLPICNGPCSQKMIETPKSELHNICVQDVSEVSTESFIIDLYEKKMRSLQLSL